MSFSDRRAQRRWRREVERRLRELDRLDAADGLGALPPQEHRRIDHRPIGSARPARRSARRSHGAALPGLLIAVLLAGFVLLRDPGVTGDRLRDLLGLTERRADVVGDPGGDGEFRFAATQRDGERPVSWNPCEEIEYVVNPEGAPGHWEELVEESVDRLGTATGFQFAYGGTTDDRNFTRRIGATGRSAPVLIGWADEDEVEELAGDVAGVGGSAYLDTSGRRFYSTGMVVLDTDVFAEVDSPEEAELQSAILDHELGHVVGLGHVDSPEELMYEDNVGRTAFGAGDLQGLARLGAVPCS